MADKHVVVAPVGDRMDALYVGIKEFPTEEVVLIVPPERIADAKTAALILKKFKIPVRIINIKGNIWEEMFKAINQITKYEDRNVIVNVATGDRGTQCAATSAAFVNGLKAFDVMGKEAMLLPVLKFSYYKLLTDRKMEILRLLSEPGCCSSLDQLSKNAKMSLPLISYHINGNLKSEGLKQLGLVQTLESRGKVSISLTSLGKMLIKGYF